VFASVFIVDDMPQPSKASILEESDTEGIPVLSNSLPLGILSLHKMFRMGLKQHMWNVLRHLSCWESRIQSVPEAVYVECVEACRRVLTLQGCALLL